jgi:hypothetical protein
VRRHDWVRNTLARAIFRMPDWAHDDLTHAIYPYRMSDWVDCVTLARNLKIENVFVKMYGMSSVFDSRHA